MAASERGRALHLRGRCGIRGKPVGEEDKGHGKFHSGILGLLGGLNSKFGDWSELAVGGL